ncbi:LysR family transcriptional regulator [Leptolyngbya sp. NIES-2104]|uniref:LysR family transcriptional regulator n=1 Tax=Leptolyngbya sp. NIES-2104 TaxID=1552121 RepID=UPI0006ECA889|nr:LysR family transcriptional regulator [Leptolyngbya sp. NIES-2104]GAP98005.1 transcriptional regulator [Leptolyngbya sp. NIES-2104]
MRSIELSEVDLNLLVAFEALFEEHSVTAAAQRLYLGQPAMSAALGRLRGLFNDELFLRVGREMQPTSKAIAIAPGIFAALHQIRQTLQTSQAFDPASDQRDFAIGSTDYTSFVVVPKLIAYCCQIAPKLNFRMIGFEKDSVGELLEKSAADLALGVFPNPPRQMTCTPLFQEHFVGIARRNHPAMIRKPLSLELFANLSHALVTVRRDTIGEVDRALAMHNLKRRIAITVPHMLVLPSIIASSDLVAAIPSRTASYFSTLDNIEVFKLPIEMQSWTVSMMWSKLADQDDVNYWLRQTIQTVCEQI